MFFGLTCLDCGSKDILIPEPSMVMHREGNRVTFPMPEPSTCKPCGGSRIGYKEPGWKPCRKCNGTGLIPDLTWCGDETCCPQYLRCLVCVTT